MAGREMKFKVGRKWEWTLKSFWKFKFLKVIPKCYSTRGPSKLRKEEKDFLHLRYTEVEDVLNQIRWAQSQGIRKAVVEGSRILLKLIICWKISEWAAFGFVLLESQLPKYVYVQDPLAVEKSQVLNLDYQIVIGIS